MPKTPTSFLDFDRLTFKAEFDTAGRLVVRRYQESDRRGRWVFEFQANATWQCIECSDPWLKANHVGRYTPEFVPDVVKLKAREFLSRKVEIVPKAESPGASN